MTQTPPKAERKSTMRLDEFIKITPPGPKRNKHADYNWYAECGDLSTYSPEKEEAIANLKGAVDWALTGDYTPAMILFRGWMAVVWRDPRYGWIYQIKDPDERGEEGKTILLRSCSGSGDDSRRQAMRHVRNHMTDIMWGNHRDWKHDILDTFFPDSLTNEDDQKDRHDFLRMCAWQERYTELKDEGMQDHEIREQLRVEGR